MMLIFYIVCGCIIFAVAGVIMQFNRLAIYRRRIIRHFAALPQYAPPAPPFMLSKAQEKLIKHNFLKGVKIQQCIDQLAK